MTHPHTHTHMHSRTHARMHTHTRIRHHQNLRTAFKSSITLRFMLSKSEITKSGMIHTNIIHKELSIAKKNFLSESIILIRNIWKPLNVQHNSLIGLLSPHLYDESYCRGSVNRDSIVYKYSSYEFFGHFQFRTV